jgi:hypothetical protein
LTFCEFWQRAEPSSKGRALLLHRVLKPAGAIYLHCDPAASH